MFCVLFYAYAKKKYKINANTTSSTILYGLNVLKHLKPKKHC